MTDTSVLLSGEQVPRGCLEEREGRRIVEAGRVRHVDDDRCTLERRAEALAGGRVDPEPRRCRDGLVPVLGETRHDLRADEPGAPDDDDLHEGVSSRCGAWDAAIIAS